MSDVAGRDPRIDAYIAKAAPFAQPILEYFRDAVHEACPEVEETLKWSAPSFVYRGRILAGMAAFKQHASFGYWQHAQVMGADAPREGMGSYGRLAAIEALPARKRLLSDIRRAMRLNERDAAPDRGARAKPAAPRPEPEVPADLAAALAGNRRAKAVFDGFSPSHRREYMEWISEAKREQTRTRRLTQAVEWIAEGRRRHWKYERD